MPQSSASSSWTTYGAARPRVEVEAELRSAFANPSFVGAITLTAMLDPASERDQGAERTLHAVPYPMLCTPWLAWCSDGCRSSSTARTHGSADRWDEAAGYHPQW